MRVANALITAVICSSPFAICAAQAPANVAPVQTQASAPLSPVSAMMQPALNTVQRTVSTVRVDKWKKGGIRDEASQNISEILRDVQVSLPPLLRDADTGPGSLSKLLPVNRNVSALYDVLLRVVEASRVVGPDDQVQQLQQALVTLGNARLALNNRMQGSAEATEKQVVDLRATIQQQAAQRQATLVPVALPCATPPVHRTTRKTTAKTPSTGKPNTTNTNQQSSH